MVKKVKHGGRNDIDGYSGTNFYDLKWGFYFE